MSRKQIIGTALAFLISATSLVAQTKSSPSKTPAKKAGTPASPFRPALLKPSALVARAPETYDVKFTTTKGDFVVRVTRAWAPRGADRFYNLVRNGFYDNCSFFRVVPNFVVQFGLSPYPEVNRAWINARIQDDPVLKQNIRGRITFAKSNLPNSRTVQVFINYTDRNTFLDKDGFAPFGEVVLGMDVVDRLYMGYGDETTNLQNEIANGGKAFLDARFPKLDGIQSAKIIAQSPTALGRGPQ